MKIINETNLQYFEFWGNAKETAKRIDEELGASGLGLVRCDFNRRIPRGDRRNGIKRHTRI